ncbi:MAG: hypothetical protein KC464_35465, partial [Myxococcales bacterium]|nr:hypothetical protein [Myxococcales bacterium]
RDGREWDGLGDAVRRVLAASATPPRVELAAASTAARPVRYDDLVHAMDAVIDGGAPDVRVADPHELTIRPTL